MPSPETAAELLRIKRRLDDAEACHDCHERRISNLEAQLAPAPLHDPTPTWYETWQERVGRLTQGWALSAPMRNELSGEMAKIDHAAYRRGFTAARISVETEVVNARADERKRYRPALQRCLTHFEKLRGDDREDTSLMACVRAALRRNMSAPEADHEE